MRAGAFIAVLVALSAIVSVYIFGPMGQRCSTLTVASVLEAVNSAQGAEEQDHNDDHDDEVERKLLAYGIDSSESDANAKRHCLNVVEQDRFWSSFAHLHPNHKRVKMWLWVHERYRTQMQRLVDAATGDGFEAFLGKIKAHSEFEDEQLFKFFVDTDPDVAKAVAALEAQHSDLNASERVFEAMKSGEGVKDALEKYQSDLLEHLAAEERVIVHRWLNLSVEDYAKYRSYISWKYSFMY